jgi:hypothetical protein
MTDIRISQSEEINETRSEERAAQGGACKYGRLPEEGRPRIQFRENLATSSKRGDQGSAFLAKGFHER